MVAILQKLPGTDHLFIEACCSKLMFMIFINFTCLSNMTHYIRHSKHLGGYETPVQIFLNLCLLKFHRAVFEI